MYDQNGAVTGRINLNYISYSYTAGDIHTWAHQIEFDASSITGTAVGYSIEGRASCTDACTVNTSDFAPQLMTVHGDQNGESFFDTTVANVGEVGFSSTTWTWWFNRPDGSGRSSNGLFTQLQVRCDNAVPTSTATRTIGCVFPGYTPTMTYSLSGPYPELASHIRRAQASGLPGAPGTSPLTRLTDQTLQAKNRSTACKSSYPPVALKDCDEYPFSSTHQGAYTGGGAPRTFTGCSITLSGTPSTGSTGYSVCMINSDQNQRGGSALQQFNVAVRIIEADPFYVRIDP